MVHVNLRVKLRRVGDFYVKFSIFIKIAHLSVSRYFATLSIERLKSDYQKLDQNKLLNAGERDIQN